MIHCGDCLEILRTLPTESVNCCVTSPPYYGLRDYGVSGQIGLEQSPEEYVAKLVDVFHEVRRVLRWDGTLWLNLGDSYAAGGMSGAHTGLARAAELSDGNKRNRSGARAAYETNIKRTPTNGLKPKDLIGIPWRVAFALQADGWYLRQDIIWHKPNPMSESVKDRCTKAHEYVFPLSKSARYFYDCEAVREPIKQTSGLNFRARARTANGALGGDNKHHMESRVFTGVKGANRRSVWTIPTKPYKGAHFATFPPALVEPCILAGCPAGGTVIDPFFGSGTVGAVAVKHGRDFVGIELNPEYIALAEKRIRATQPPLMMAL